MTGLAAALRRAAGTVTDVACRAAGRRNVVRAARLVLNRARLDVPNDMSANGETALQDWVLDLCPVGEALHVVDVGANIGRWSTAMLDAARRRGRAADLHLHAFEPASSTFCRLAGELNGQRVAMRRAALSDHVGSSNLHVIAPGAGTNSMHEAPDLPADATREKVTTTTLDAYATREGIGHIALAKVDTEGHDMAVLRGARDLLAEHRIAIAQFEYNHRWVYARAFLRDAFDLLEPLGYRVGKLTPAGVELYSGWDAELETFIEGNYVACGPGVAERLPSIKWWKSANSEGSVVAPGIFELLKALGRPLPGMRRLSLLRQRVGFRGSVRYWEDLYASGGTSGAGSYGYLAVGKADFLNAFVRHHQVESVIEFGCGDGNQLALAAYPLYVGLDVSRTAIERCAARFADDPTKSFFSYDGGCFVDRSGTFTADVAISIDVIYHLVEDSIFETYMAHLFNASRRYVVIYATDTEVPNTAPHVRHRNFTSWVSENCRAWRLDQVARGPRADADGADFFVFERIIDVGNH